MKKLKLVRAGDVVVTHDLGDIGEVDSCEMDYCMVRLYADDLTANTESPEYGCETDLAYMDSNEFEVIDHIDTQDEANQRILVRLGDVVVITNGINYGSLGVISKCGVQIGYFQYMRLDSNDFEVIDHIDTPEEEQAKRAEQARRVKDTVGVVDEPQFQIGDIVRLIRTGDIAQIASYNPNDKLCPYGLDINGNTAIGSSAGALEFISHARCSNVPSASNIAFQVGITLDEADERMEEHRRESALAWMRGQAKELDPSIADDESVSQCARVISSAIFSKAEIAGYTCTFKKVGWSMRLEFTCKNCKHAHLSIPLEQILKQGLK